MNILVFGSTGGTGREIVVQGLEQGHGVTAFARDPTKLEDIKHPQLTVVRGDVLDASAVSHAVEGNDAVFVAIGAGAARSTLREEGTRIIVEAMEGAGVRRLLCLSSLGVGDSRENLGFITRYIIVGIFLRHAFADHERQEAIVKQSGLDWTIVRPPHLKDGSRTGDYQHGFAPSYRQIRAEISRADVADLMLKQLDDDTYVRKTPGVSY